LLKKDIRAPSKLDAKRRSSLLAHCRLKAGQIWRDPVRGHRVGCLDATDGSQVRRLCGKASAALAVQDPPYNVAALQIRTLDEYIGFSRAWVSQCLKVLKPDSAFYVWLGADQSLGFQPLPDFMLLMREFPQLKPRSFITMRNQRGYGTQKNWMSVRQELLYYTQGDPLFKVQYTQIPKILRGYYKKINGKRMENLERGKSPNIRAGNVWVDIQQVFHLLRENVPYAFAQKPLAAIERIVQASSQPGDLVVDFFSHAGTTLLASERLGRRCHTMDVDPIFCELSIRRLERFRATGELGWQRKDPFDPH
jgi:site-specific DNA-methyltransferase (adenine-specific)